MRKSAADYNPWDLYPNKVLAFLKSDLQIGKRYLVMDISAQESGMTQLLHNQIHFLCSVSTTPNENKQNSIATADFLSLNATPDIIPVEDDAMHSICIDDVLVQFDPFRVAKEFERILRLNSYVLFFQKRIKKKEGEFGAEFKKWLKINQSSAKVIAPLAPKSLLVDFFDTGLYTKDFEHQIYLDWEELQKYSSLLLPNYEVNSLKELFEQYQIEGRVKVEYIFHLTYGLFNKSVPEISLRKSIFFNILRPFAFGFYILVKANIYFWKSLYKVKDRIFSKNGN